MGGAYAYLNIKIEPIYYIHRYLIILYEYKVNVKPLK